MLQHIDWESKPFMELSLTELHDILRLRQEIFVVEQRCVFNDIDGVDPHCLHVFARDRRTQAMVACARVVPPGRRFDDPSIGRVVTAVAARGIGLGHALVKKSVSATRQQYGAVAISLSAQAHLEGFYAQHGFACVNDIFEEDGIPHVVMRALI